MTPSRRSFLAGLFCAPAIVRASSLMSIVPWEEETVVLHSRNSLLTINMITREAVRLFKNSNQFLANVNYQESFPQPYLPGFGSSLRIRLPNDFGVSHLAGL